MALIDNLTVFIKNSDECRLELEIDKDTVQFSFKELHFVVSIEESDNEYAYMRIFLPKILQISDEKQQTIEHLLLELTRDIKIVKGIIMPDGHVWLVYEQFIALENELENMFAKGIALLSAGYNYFNKNNQE
jgi:hypothetical protein